MKNIIHNSFSRRLPAAVRRSLWGLGVGLLLGSSAGATQPFPLYEPFPYGENEQLGTSGSSGTNWDFGNSISSSCSRILAAGALAYPGMPADTNETPRGLQSRTASTS